MKVLVFGDLHGDHEVLSTLSKQAKEVDVVVCVGDISSFETDLDFLVSQLDGFSKPVLIIHGNHEDESNMAVLCSSLSFVQYVHKKSVLIDDVLFLGHGGGGFSQFAVDFPKAQFAKEIKDFRKKNHNGKIVLIIHQPPHDTAVDNLDGLLTGNIDYKAFIEREKIDLVVCGHIHENFGKEDLVGKTLIVNPGCKGRVFTL